MRIIKQNFEKIKVFIYKIQIIFYKIIVFLSNPVFYYFFTHFPS